MIRAEPTIWQTLIAWSPALLWLLAMVAALAIGQILESRGDERSFQQWKERHKD
jgi:hypothetical protein